MKVKNLIIGAGLSGCYLGHLLKSKKEDDYVILEKENAPGGLCRTKKTKGFYFDFTGHYFHFPNPDAQRIFLKDFPLKKYSADPGIYYKNKIIDFPFQLNLWQYSLKEFKDGFISYIQRRRGKTNDFSDLLRSRYGSGFFKQFLNPYNKKITSHNLKNLAPDDFKKFLPPADYEDIFYSFIKKEKFSKNYNSFFYYPSKSGVGGLINKMSAGLNIKYGAKIKAVDINKKYIEFFSNEKIYFKNLISSISLTDLLDYASVKYPPVFLTNAVYALNCGIKGKPFTKKSWVYFASPSVPFYRIGVYSNVLDYFAPRGYSSYYIEISAPPSGKKISPPALFKKIKNSFKKLNIDFKPAVKDFIYMNPGYVYIKKGGYKKNMEIKKALRKKGVYLMGRYGKWEYSAMGDSINDALNILKKIC